MHKWYSRNTASALPIVCQQGCLNLDRLDLVATLLLQKEKVDIDAFRAWFEVMKKAWGPSVMVCCMNPEGRDYYLYWYYFLLLLLLLLIMIITISIIITIIIITIIILIIMF